MSFTSSKGKQYGLIIPAKKFAAKPLAKKCVFGDSSSDEDDDGKRHVNTSLRREHEKRAKQTHEAAARALEEDPSIFEYDSLYDKMTEEKKKADPKLHRDKQPKYIHTLKKAAERRKLESDIVYEHMAQKELEKEKGEFDDKERFVTSAYKKKLEERKKLEEELAREAALEEANDVRKQKDLSRFQKHLFKQVISPNAVEREKEKDLKSERDKVGDGGRRKEEEERREGKEGRERWQNFDREKREHEREEKRHDEDSHPHKRRESEEGKRDSEGGERRRRRDSHGREESTSQDRSKRVDRDSIEGTTSLLSPPRDNELEKKLPPAPPPKKTKLEAGIEVEEEEVDTVDRRKLAATKRSTDETAMSAKERYLARKRAKLETEREED